MKKIFVGNFSFSTTDADLRQWFTQYGSVDNTTGGDRPQHRPLCGFGFVEMPNSSEGEAAIAALNGMDSGGRALTVNEARPQADPWLPGRRWGRCA